MLDFQETSSLCGLVDVVLRHTTYHHYMCTAKDRLGVFLVMNRFVLKTLKRSCCIKRFIDVRYAERNCVPMEATVLIGSPLELSVLFVPPVL